MEGTRALRITPKGRRLFREVFGVKIELSSPADERAAPFIPWNLALVCRAGSAVTSLSSASRR